MQYISEQKIRINKHRNDRARSQKWSTLAQEYKFFLPIQEQRQLCSSNIIHSFPAMQLEQIDQLFQTRFNHEPNTTPLISKFRTSIRSICLTLVQENTNHPVNSSSFDLKFLIACSK
mmetsp:Transcript_50493/g.50865  ORF Transcript_50493/g.50865 Transcript_50493/m.50865 type:complete len:117 (-) Transcript_50493:53-403(-)